jgi:uncharacterized damage-inducible protein DinB
LNHIAVGDTLWMRRFIGFSDSPSIRSSMDDFPQPVTLRDILGQQLSDLRTFRNHLDQLILEWSEDLNAQKLSSTFAYINVAGVPSSRNFGALIQHFFNHQTHHRGQVTTLLFQAGVDVDVTDLLAIIPQEPH